MDKPIILDIPYPTLNTLVPDLRSGRIISGAYAGNHGELTAILQYVYHHYYFKEEGDEETADTLIGIAIAEMKHLSILGETLLKLGIDPIFARFPPYKCDFYSTAHIGYSVSPKKMLMDDVSGEAVAVADYERILRELDNEEVASVISRIKLDEELHIRVLKGKLSKYC